MKKYLLTGVALAALGCGSALAADLPARRGMPVKAPEPVGMPITGPASTSVRMAAAAVSEKCFTFAGLQRWLP